MSTHRDEPMDRLGGAQDVADLACALSYGFGQITRDRPSDAARHSIVMRSDSIRSFRPWFNGPSSLR